MAQKSTKLYVRKQSCFRDLIFSVCKCSECDLIFVNPRLPKNYTPEIYSNSYYEGEGIDGNFQGTSARKQDESRMLVRAVLGPGPKSFLDVGGGLGLVTQAALEQGHQALSCDLSTASIESAQKKRLPAILAAPDHLLDCYAGAFDVIVALEVIEHTYSPSAFLKSIYTLLRPGDVFVFTTGNASEARISGRAGLF